MEATARPQQLLLGWALLAPWLLPLRAGEGAVVMDDPNAMRPLLGEYGFLTQFANISEAEARRRVRHMAGTYRIREFQFYDAFRGYSDPPGPDEKFWHTALFSRPVNRTILLAYADEIKQQGGRSWFYVQAVGSDPGDSELESGFRVIGQHVVMGKPLLDVIVPNASWARRVAPHWADFVASLGFSGIHWDTLGDFASSVNAGMDMRGFLEAALPIVRARGLDQTANFVDGAGWDPMIWRGPRVMGNTVAFPYWEVWTTPQMEDRFFQMVAPAGGGVFVCYPGKSVNHKGERANWQEKGVWPFDLMIKRWVKARCLGNAYLAVGDGDKHIQTEYFPDTSGISKVDRQKLVELVFKNASCPETTTTSAPGAGCFEEGVAYDPIDMDARYITVAVTAKECQRQCAALEGCHHFSYYEPLGHCHFESAFAVKAHLRPGFTAGPASCEEEQGAGRFSLPELDCLEPGTAYLPAITDPERMENRLSAREAVLRCQQRCAGTEQCAHFTVNFGLIGSGLFCSLADERSLRIHPVLQQISGPSSCKWTLVQAKFLRERGVADLFRRSALSARAAVCGVAASVAAVACAALLLPRIRRGGQSRRDLARWSLLRPLG